MVPGAHFLRWICVNRFPLRAHFQPCKSVKCTVGVSFDLWPRNAGAGGGVGLRYPTPTRVTSAGGVLRKEHYLNGERIDTPS